MSVIGFTLIHTMVSPLFLLFTLAAAAAEDPTWNDAPWIGSSANAVIGDASDLFRTTFTTPADAGNGSSSAILHVATLGMGFSRINGLEVSDDRLTHSGWTDNENRVLYSTYDVSSLLAPAGEANVLAIAVGTGWRDQITYPRRDDTASSTEDSTHLRLCRAILELPGTTVVVTTSQDWWTAPGPWLRTSIYNGESRLRRLYPE